MSTAYLVIVHSPTRHIPLWVSHAGPLLKAGSTPPGARWITVHPGGRDSDHGVPVLIQETHPGSGVHRVIGGAGGKLNYLRMTGVKSESEYRQQAKSRQQARKQQRKEDKALGLDKRKREDKQRVDEQLVKKRQEVIDDTAKAMGWTGHKFDPTPYENLSREAQTKAYHEHQKEWLGKARAAVDAQRQALLVDHEARAEVLPSVPLVPGNDPAAITLSDLATEPDSSGGLGYKVDYRGAAERHGATEDVVQAEKAALDPDTQEATSKRKATVEGINAELAAARASEAPKDAPIKLVEAEQAAALIRAEKELALLERQARQAKAKIDAGAEDKGAFVLEVSAADVDEAVQKQFEADLRTASTRAFLSAAEAVGPTAKHLGIGAYNAVNALAVTVSGAGLMDRMAMDVLGVAGSCWAVARRLHQDLGPDEVERIHAAMEAYHSDHYMPATEAAMGEALRWQKAAEGLTAEAADNGHDLARLQEINAKRKAAIGQAQRIMGQTLGEMEANAGLVLALGAKPKDRLELNMGAMSTEAAVRRVRAIGLQPGDYEINSVGSQRFLTLNASGLDRVTTAIDKEGERVTRRALDIQAGKEDEAGWLPQGMADRPDLASKSMLQPGTAPQFAEPFRPGPDMAESIKDYIGARAADGDLARDIVDDLRSQDLMDRAGARRDEYIAERDRLVPFKGADGSQLNTDTMQGDFDALADEYVQKRFGVARSPLHKQTIPHDEVAVEALHRALADEPAGALAFKAVGDLSLKEQGALRRWWNQAVGVNDPRGAEKAQELADHLAKEPDRWMPGTTDEVKNWYLKGHEFNKKIADAALGSAERNELEAARKAHIDNSPVDDFAQVGESPEYKGWVKKRTKLTKEADEAGLNWEKYTRVMGGPTHAYAATQDMIRGQVARKFADTYNTLRPGAPLKVGRAMLSHHIRHLDAIDPEARDKRLSELYRLKAQIQGQAVGGGWASGKVADKMDDAKAEKEAVLQSQMGLFGDLDFGEPGEPQEKPLQPGERHTLGVAAERTLAGMAGLVGQNFRAGKPVKLWHSSMDGAYINGQRAVKMLENSKRLVLSQGVGSGKTKMGLASFAHLHGQGKVRRGLYAVPSVVQGQFGGEALRYLEPGQFKWHAEPGASREERLAAYRDPETHFVVVTHQALRDDLVHLGAKGAGISDRDMAERVRAMSPAERKTWMRETMDAHGIDHDFLMVDEGHDLLGRAGKEDSLMANVVDAVAHNTPYYISASADPIKNDPSELHSLLSKVDPDRYADAAEFKRRYGVDTPAAKDALRREIARYHFPGSVDPGVQARHSVQEVPLSTAQQEAMRAVEKAAGSARLARMKGQVDVDAIKVLSPDSFTGVDPARHQEVAKTLTDTLAIIKLGAVRRVIDEHDQGAKLDAVSRLAKSKAGKPGVVFAHSLAAVSALEKRLRAEGHRVATLIGNGSAKDKDRKRLAFNPEQGEPTADILIASDAGAVGLNLQRGQWLVQYDTPDTAKTWRQRQGRIHRLGQKQDVDLIDLVGDHPAERRARERLAKKDELRSILTSPMEGADDTGLAAYLARAQADQQQMGLF